MVNFCWFFVKLYHNFEFCGLVASWIAFWLRYDGYDELHKRGAADVEVKPLVVNDWCMRKYARRPIYKLRPKNSSTQSLPHLQSWRPWWVPIISAVFFLWFSAYTKKKYENSESNQRLSVKYSEVFTKISKFAMD